MEWTVSFVSMTNEKHIGDLLAAEMETLIHLYHFPLNGMSGLKHIIKAEITSVGIII